MQSSTYPVLVVATGWIVPRAAGEAESTPNRISEYKEIESAKFMCRLSPTLPAAIVQLAVPVLAAIGGVLFLSEAITYRLVIASIVICGKVAMAICGRDCTLRIAAETNNG